MECDSVSRKSGFEWGWSNCSLAAKSITAPNMAPSCWIYPVLWSLAALSFCIWFGSACVLSLLGTYLGAPSSVGIWALQCLAPRERNILGLANWRQAWCQFTWQDFQLKWTSLGCWGHWHWELPPAAPLLPWWWWINVTFLLPLLVLWCCRLWCFALLMAVISDVSGVC